MPQSLLEGYMAGKRYLQQREEKEEEQKREKLTDQIRELEFKKLTRGLERSAEEWERQKKAYQQKEEAILEFNPEQQQHIRAGLGLTEKKEPKLMLGTPKSGHYRYNAETGEYDFIREKEPSTDFKKAAYERQLLEMNPSELTEKQERYLRGLGYWYNLKIRSWEKKPTKLPEELLKERVKEKMKGPSVFAPSGAVVEVPEELKGLDLSGFGKKEEPEYTQEQIDSYNACRDRGGTKEECRLEAGL